jgi:hypothetical protein
MAWQSRLVVGVAGQGSTTVAQGTVEVVWGDGEKAGEEDRR